MLYPNIDLQDIANPGERIVAETLVSQCPGDWTIIYSKSWLWREVRYSGDRFREGEIDFVVVVPNKGFVCLEVKAARDYRLTQDGIWQRFDEESSQWVSYRRSPWVQVQVNRHNLAGVLCQRLRTPRLRCAYGAAVVFPRGRRQGLLPAGEGDEATVVDAAHMEDLRQIIEGIVDGWSSGPGETDDIVRALCPPGAEFCSSLSLEIGNSNRRLVRLTENQCRVLSGLRQNKMILVLGGAGTGKTLLGLELAREELEKGRRVLFLCFSRKLAEWTASQARHERFTSANFHALARRYAAEASVRWPTNPDDSFWESGVGEVFLDSLRRLGNAARFDTVIIDEVQDFVGEWLIPSRELWNDAGRFAVFGDGNQALFGSEILEHKQMAKFVLQDNCRNTYQVAALCNRILGDAGVEVDPDSIASLPSGSAPRLARWGPAQTRKSETVSQVKRWCEGGLLPSQVAVLSPWNEGNSLGIGAGDCEVDNLLFTRDLDTWRAGKAFFFDTIRGFKGLEADALIVTDVVDFGGHFSHQDAYVACSRARHELVVVPADARSHCRFGRWLGSPGGRS